MKKRPSWWFEFLRVIWPITTMSARMTQWPVVGRLLTLLVRPLFVGKNFHITHIPVNLDVQGGSTHIPELVLEELIRRSAHRVTINRCHCRDSEKCQHFPIEDACLHLGEGTSYLDPHIATPRSVEGAIAHMRKMIGLGLIPMIGRVRMDDIFYGTPNTGRSLTVCFCCPCCCTIFKSTRYFPHEVKDSLVRLKGLRVSIENAGCTRCGICVDECFTRALSLTDTGVAWDASLCKGCGHCVAVCPEKVMSVSVDDLDEAIQDIMGRMNERVNIGPDAR